ncbi:MAG: BrnT family toxin [Acidobacteriota bacterium]|nr:BrnT family toxin [Acidobacteriota bacterium]
MDFEWDPKKAAANLRKHGIDFADAVLALEDELALTVRDDRFDDEDRYVTLGMDDTSRLLVVIFTWRGDRIRLISARRATSKERRQYEAKP